MFNEDEKENIVPKVRPNATSTTSPLLLKQSLFPSSYTFCSCSRLDDLLTRCGSRRPARSRFLRSLRSILQSPIFSIFVLICTLLSLFLYDLVIVFGDPSMDIYVMYVLFVIFLFFTFEIISSCIVLSGYFLSFFFWFDLIGTFSLIAFFPFINEGNAFRAFFIFRFVFLFLIYYF